MGLFGRDIWKHGARTTGTIERIAVTNTTNNSSGNSTVQRVFLTFAYRDELGQAVTREEKFWVGPDAIPQPGARVELAYDGGRIDYDQRTMREPDPAAVRGWAAGILEVEDLGDHKGHALMFKGDVEEQRELFRSPSSLRRTAEVTHVKTHLTQRRAMHGYTISLRIDGELRDVKVWAPWYSVPGEGDLIEVAISPDGRGIALDSDERFSGPPGQALVWRRPAGAPPRPTQQERLEAEAFEMFAPALGQIVQQEQPPPGFFVQDQQLSAGFGGGQLPAGVASALVDQQLAGLKAARPMLGDQYEPAVRALLAQSGLTGDEHDRRLRDALA